MEQSSNSFNFGKKDQDGSDTKTELMTEKTQFIDQKNTGKPGEGQFDADCY